jgi:hypothetical protein
MSREHRKPHHRGDRDDRQPAVGARQSNDVLPATVDHARASVEGEGHALGRIAINRPAEKHDFSQMNVVPLQPKLIVNQSGDAFELEADAVADAVAGVSEPGVEYPAERATTITPDGRPLQPMAAPAPPKPPTVVQRDVTENDSARAEPAALAPSPAVQSQVLSLRGGGQGLDPETKSFMESRFGHDFGRVRVHTDSGATASARGLEARAFTIGSDIAFAAGQYQPHTPMGRHLLAHELTHVVQQEDVSAAGPIGDSAVNESVLTVQRDSAPAAAAAPPAPEAAQAGSWNAPEDFGAIDGRTAARTALGEMLKTVDGYKDVEIGEIPQQRAVTRKAIESRMAKLDADGTLTQAEASDLNSLTLVYNAFNVSAKSAFTKAVRAGLSGLFHPPGMGEVYAAIDDAKHALFRKPNDDKLEKIKDATEKVKDLSEKVKWIADNSLRIVEDVEKAKKIFEMSEKLEKFGGVLEKLLSAKKVGDDLMVLSREAGGGTSSLGGADAIDAGVDLAGLIGKSAMKAVPLFGTYWNDYLVPMTKKCTDMLRKVEDMADSAAGKEVRRLVNWDHPSPTPPELEPATYVSMEGGKEVFDYIYLTRFGAQPGMSSNVEKVIMKHREVLEKSSGSDVELEEAHWYNPLSWVNRKAKDLPAWVKEHIGEVWASFYGSMG